MNRKISNENNGQKNWIRHQFSFFFGWLNDTTKAVASERTQELMNRICIFIFLNSKDQIEFMKISASLFYFFCSFDVFTIFNVIRLFFLPFFYFFIIFVVVVAVIQKWTRPLHALSCFGDHSRITSRIKNGMKSNEDKIQNVIQLNW